MGDIKDRRTASYDRPPLSVAMILIALTLFVQPLLTGLITAEIRPPDKEESPSKPEGKKDRASIEPKEENSPEERRGENANGPSGYPRTYIVPKGLCEGNEPVMTIESFGKR